MIKVVSFLLLLLIVAALPEADKVHGAPGMHEASIWSGFLDTGVKDRKMHYVFVQANVSDPRAAPLAIWLNGGPGCSSLMGMLSEVGPYIIGNDYQQGDLLKKNDYGWSNAANMLFLQSPSIVGFSTETDPHYHWTDEQTARDLLFAIADFVFEKGPQYENSSLYVQMQQQKITGESYAGKYIPDVAMQIINFNRRTEHDKINLKGIMVGNGVMNFQDYSLDKSSVDFLLDHDMISNRIEGIYKNACGKDYHSPRCKFSKYQIGIFQAYVNPYNIYETCTKGNHQTNRLREMLKGQKSVRNETHINRPDEPLGEIPECPSSQGGIKYWNLNKYAFHVENISKTWSVCSHLNYSISQRGSMDEYRQIFINGGVRVWLYSGDFDDVVPFTDTEKNVDKLYRVKEGGWSSWSVKDQHGGFFQSYDGDFTVITVKGAGHMVPENQPKASFQLFSNFINGKGVNNQIY